MSQAGFAAGAIAAEHRFAFGILDAVDIDFDFIADRKPVRLAGHGEFAQRHAAFALEADVDDGLVVFNCGDGALDDAAFKAASAGAAERFVEERGEIVAGRVGNRCHM